MKKITVAVTGLSNNNDNPAPGVAVIRCLRESKFYEVKIIGLYRDINESGIYSGLCDLVFEIPGLLDMKGNLYNAIERIKKAEKINMIISTLDAEMYHFTNIQEKLNFELNIKTFLPSQRSIDMREKIKLNYFLNHGFNIPRYDLVGDISDIIQARRKYGETIVIKGNQNNALICHTELDAINAMKIISNEFSPEPIQTVIAQEFISGQEYCCAGIGDGTGVLMNCLTMRKIKINSKGKGIAGVSVQSKEIIEIAKLFCERTHWRGAFEIEMIQDSKNNFFIIEINPRFPSWIYLSTRATNQPETLIKMAMGELVPMQWDNTEDLMFFRNSYDSVTHTENYLNNKFKSKN